MDKLLERIARLSPAKRELLVRWLCQEANIEHLASVLRQKGSTVPQSSLVEIQPGGTKPPFFCVHPVGGTVFCYSDLAWYLGPDQPFYGLQARGILGTQFAQNHIEDMATHYIGALRTAQFAGPYLLGGWSMGGVVAFEMAQQLQEQGQEVALLALLDTTVPTAAKEALEEDEVTLLANFAKDLGSPLDLSAPSLEHFSRLELHEQLRYLLQQARIAHVVPPDIDITQIQLLFHLYGTHVYALRQYRAQVYHGRLTLFRARDQVSGGFRDSTVGWSKLAAGGVDVRVIPGDHRSMLREPYVQILAKQLRECLERAFE